MEAFRLGMLSKITFKLLKNKTLLGIWVAVIMCVLHGLVMSQLSQHNCTVAFFFCQNLSQNFKHFFPADLHINIDRRGGFSGSLKTNCHTVARGQIIYTQVNSQLKVHFRKWTEMVRKSITIVTISDLQARNSVRWGMFLAIISYFLNT